MTHFKLWLAPLVVLIQTAALADPQLDVEELMNDMLPFGHEMLEQHGEFLPYGAATKTNGEIVSVASVDGDEHPRSQEVIANIKAAFQKAAEEHRYKATALFYDVTTVLPRTKEKSDAIAVALDHVDNVSITVFLPYELEGKRVVFGETFARRGQNEIFRK